MRDAIFVFIDTVEQQKPAHISPPTHGSPHSITTHTHHGTDTHTARTTHNDTHTKDNTTNQTLDSQPPTRCILYRCVAPAIALPRDASSGSYAPGGGTSTFSFLIFNRSDVEENDADRRSRLRERSDVGCVCSYPPGPGMPSASRFRGSCVRADVDAKEAEMRF